MLGDVMLGDEDGKMKKIYVCSPLRGRDGQPSATNVALARRLMRAVFDAGHAPFAPHLLYPQVLTENEADLKVAFAANLTWLAASNEIWVWGRRIEECTGGMKLEIDGPGLRYRPKVVWMPGEFVKVEMEGWRAEALGREGVVPRLGAGASWARHGPTGECVKCHTAQLLNREGWCLSCFSAGTPR